MTILAVCPYCKTGKIRAPRSALGASATCPRCLNCFTVADAEDVRATAARLSSALPKPAATIPRQVDLVDVPNETIDEPPEIMIPDLPSTRHFDDHDDDARPGASGFAMALVAIIIAGFAFGATQIPAYGRLIAAGFAVAGMAVSLLALASSDGRWKWPAIAGAFNGACVLLILMLPSWVNLGPWWPERIQDDSHLVKSVGFQGGASVVDGEWVDASKGAWQQNDVRVTISAVRAGRTEVIGPGNKSEWSKSRLLVIGVRVANIGVVRRLQYRSWNELPTPDSVPVRVTTSDGKLLAPARSVPGYTIPGRLKSAELFPGKSTDDVLVYEVPEKDVEYIRIELPGWGIESNEAVKMHIPRPLIVTTK